MSKIFNKNSCDCVPLGVLIIVFVCLFVCLLLLYFLLHAFVFREEVFDSQDIKLPIQFMVGVI